MHRIRTLSLWFSALVALALVADPARAQSVNKAIEKDSNGNLTASYATGNRTLTIASGGTLNAVAGSNIILAGTTAISGNTTITSGTLANVTATGTTTLNGTISGNAVVPIAQGGTAATTADAGRAALIARPHDPRLRKTWAKLNSIGTGSVAQVRILVWSDSMNGIGGNSTMTIFGQALAQSYGDIGLGVSPTIAAAGAASTGDASASGNAANYTRWPISLPPSTTGSGGTLTYGRGGSTAYGDTIKIYYVREPGAGHFKVQTSQNFSSWSDEASYLDVDASNASMALGTITLTKAVGQWAVRIVGISGTVYFPMVRITATTVSGVELVPMAIGGLALGNANLAPADIWGGVLSDIAPDLGTFEMKEGASLSTDLAAWWSTITTYAPSADWIFFGSTPIQTDNASQVSQNAVVLAHTATYSKYYFDAYNLFGGSWTTADGYGFMTDGVHRAQRGNSYLASVLADATGFFDGPYALSPVGVRTTSPIVSASQITLAGTNADSLRTGTTPLAKISVRSGTSNQDAELALNRSLVIAAPSGGTVSFNPDGLGNSGVSLSALTTVIGLGSSGDTYLSRNASSVVKVGTGSTGGGSLGAFYGTIWGNESGTASSPSISFQNFQNRGLYPVTNGIGVSVGSSNVSSYFSTGETFALGRTVIVTSGSNALAGTVTLSSGSGTITSTAIDTNTVIVLSLKTSSGTPGTYAPRSDVGSGSATITGLSTDNSTYNWVAFKVN